MENFNPNNKIAGCLKENLKSIIKKVELQLKRGEKILEIEGLFARFKIENKNDLYRLNKNFEGEYAREIIKTFKELGEKGITVNIGAAQGFYTIYSALAGNKVLAIEPDLVTFNALKSNIELNNLGDKIKCLKCAVGEKQEKKILFTDDVQKSAPSFIKNAKQNREIEVPVLRLDEILEGNPNIFVIDVEGYEEKVLLGMGTLRPKDIFVEIHPNLLKNLGESQNSFEKLIFKMGYELKSQKKRGGELHCHFILKNVN